MNQTERCALHEVAANFQKAEVHLRMLSSAMSEKRTGDQPCLRSLILSAAFEDWRRQARNLFLFASDTAHEQDALSEGDTISNIRDINGHRRGCLRSMGISTSDLTQQEVDAYFTLETDP